LMSSTSIRPLSVNTIRPFDDLSILSMQASYS
jgi:hypothetical protein